MAVTKETMDALIAEVAQLKNQVSVLLPLRENVDKIQQDYLKRMDAIDQLVNGTTHAFSQWLRYCK